MRPSFYFWTKCYVNWWRLMWNTKNNYYSIDVGAQERNPRKMYFWFLFVSLKYTVHQNDGKFLTRSFSVEPMLTTSLKYSSTSGNALGLWRASGKWKLSTRVPNSCVQWMMVVWVSAGARLMVMPVNAYQVKFCMDFNMPPLLKLRRAGSWPNAQTGL